MMTVQAFYLPMAPNLQSLCRFYTDLNMNLKMEIGKAPFLFKINWIE